MPQINRIRVNNVKYNFGTQVYDDFCMRFHCRNTIYDLANGGGKSLLMLLLLQNLIPNCTLDEKQPIEKLFRPGSGNTVIHSLVEWKLDPCFCQDNYKYMTTGFCARAGKSSDDDSAEGNAVSKSTASVEYFNYCIFYREFGDNDIKNLPLASCGEKITYNGLKAYLRDLEKKDFNVSVRIFEKKGDYQNFISQYGLYESQWEIVRGINKTEGHVRTYFETNYRTSRKVVEDLLIEEILQKSFNNRISAKDGEDGMAETLMDIKDKLVELSKKHSSIADYDNQVQALNAFSQYAESFSDMYERKEKLKSRLYNMALLCEREVKKQEAVIEKLEDTKMQLDSLVEKEQICIQTAEVMEEEKSLKQLKEVEDKLAISLTKATEQILAEKMKLVKMEASLDYKDYVSYRVAMSKAKEALENLKRNKPDILRELKAYANEIVRRKKTLLDNLKNQLSLMQDAENKASGDYENERKNQHDIDMKLAGCMSRIAMIEERINANTGALKNAMDEAGILVGEGAKEKANELEIVLKEKNSNLSEATEQLALLSDKQEKSKSNLASINALITMYLEQISAAQKEEEKKAEISTRIKELTEIYGASDLTSLKTNISDTLEDVKAQLNIWKVKEENLSSFIDNAKDGKCFFGNKQRERLKNYLESNYGEDVIEGREWLKTLNHGQRRDVLRRAPFTEYALVIRNDYNRIKEDEFIREFEADGAIVPIMSENVLMETKQEVNSECITFAMRSFGFLENPDQRDKKIRFAMDELEDIRINIDKMADRKNFIEDDYTMTVKGEALLSVNGKTADEIKLEMDKLSKERVLQEESLLKINDRYNEYMNLKSSYEDDIEHIRKTVDACKKANEIYESISFEYKKLDVEKAEKTRLESQTSEYDARVRAKKNTYDESINAKENVVDNIKSVTDAIDNIYSPAMGETDFEIMSIHDESDENLEVKFAGLRDAMNSDAAGTKDKESLINHYRLSMEKAKAAIDYKGLNFDEVKSDYESGRTMAPDAAALRRIREYISEIEKNSTKDREEYESVSAMKNRLEGSIDHGISQIVQKFGEYKPFQCDNTSEFIAQHKGLIEKHKDDISQIEKDKKAQLKISKDLYASKKNTERIIKNAGMEILEDKLDNQIDIVQDDISKCDEVAEDFESIVKIEYKRREEFEKKKQILVKQIQECNAIDLAREIQVSVNMPENEKQVETLRASIKETNEFIMLEKTRLSESIEDMQRIKDNFENRCIQTCSNIKTELDRLPKLSNISMDGELISIIGLSIPYVPQEQYKQRMSVYIDETVVMAESFKNQDERLKFIRNRLSWKKLFSVIVTDMNGVRINLYKRERIKDQSRYLRYEEAVGSTGQSQGIYIQFLIGIINYISSINAKPGSGVTGKTIFIDNPFGAAKDIYIWEPIFKLLKTNHVQLIVPARGATPAITGRFDVNYILGQKLVENRQQTVVVDYFSDTGNTELEYTRMDYEQSTALRNKNFSQ